MADLRGESSVDTSAKRIRLISRAEKDFSKRLFWRTHLYRNQTVVGSGVNDYTVGSATYPFRPKGLTEVFVATTGDTVTDTHKHDITDYNNFKNIYSRDSSTKVAYEWYDVANDLWKMHINPAPEATETITYSYYWEAPTRTLTSDVVICPNPKIIALLALGDLYDSEDENQKSQIYKAEAEQLITELVSLENTPAVNQRYSMTAIENMTRGNGIGTY